VIDGPRYAEAMTDPIEMIDSPGELTGMRCVACRGGEPTLTDAEIAAYRDQVPDWDVVEVDGIKRLRRVFRFPDFASALQFTDRVGALAEEQGHHPALLTEWGRTTVSWWTHKIGGLHRNDLIMAARTDALDR
jgi:4a-hydroxytetrahydrobiopterin dehydratase